MSIPTSIEYHSTDFSYAEWALAAPAYYAAEKKSSAASEEIDTTLSNGTVWDGFYTQQGKTAYQQRKYIAVEFRPYLMAEGEEKEEQLLSIMDVGAGVGSTALALLANSRVRSSLVAYTCTDCSQVGLDMLQARVSDQGALAGSGSSSSIRFNTQVWDIAACRWKEEEEGTLFNRLTCIFTLSAIHPAAHVESLRNMASALEPGGYILFRDYAVHDMTMYVIYVSSSISSLYFHHHMPF
jgi:hypothetical protein